MPDVRTEIKNRPLKFSFNTKLKLQPLLIDHTIGTIINLKVEEDFKKTPNNIRCWILDLNRNSKFYK